MPPALRWLEAQPYFQAGLQGYSDAAMRIVARRRGAPYCITESLLDLTLLSGGKALRATELDPEDHPIGGQLIGTTPRDMARAARLLLDQGYDVIDVNLACPVKKVRELCRGGHLLTRPDIARDILAAVRDEVAGEAPLTVKLRRGYDDSDASVVQFHAVLEGAMEFGFASATVHCRTVKQKYEGLAIWDFLADLTRRYPGFPILGSGDIYEASDIFRRITETGARGVAVARGAIGNPWIFAQAAAIQRGEAPTFPTIAEQRAALLEQYALSERWLGPDAAGRQMRKVAIKASRHHPRSQEVAKAFIEVRNTAQWHAAVAQWYGTPADEARLSSLSARAPGIPELASADRSL